MCMQNACGEASSSTDSDSKNVVCPTCGRTDFKNERGMKLHHARVHNESLSIGTYTCDHCGEEFTRRKSSTNLGKTGMYCSRECSAYATTGKGEDHANYNRVTVECDACGDAIERKPSRVEKTDKHYCDNSCRTFKREVECDNCGKMHIKHRKSIKRSKNIFCSPKCFDEFRRNDYEQYYGHSWTQQRQKAIVKDQCRCRICGANPTDLPREPDVHHIIPLSKFESEYDEPTCYEKANKLDNLIVLCPTHHRKWEGIPVVPDVR